MMPVVFFTLCMVAVFGGCFYRLHLSWALSVFTGERRQVAGFTVLCVLVIVLYVVVMRLVFGL